MAKAAFRAAMPRPMTARPNASPRALGTKVEAIADLMMQTWG
jgi:hypothetical protein